MVQVYTRRCASNYLLHKLYRLTRILSSLRLHRVSFQCFMTFFIMVKWSRMWILLSQHCPHSFGSTAPFISRTSFVCHDPDFTLMQDCLFMGLGRKTFNILRDLSKNLQKVAENCSVCALRLTQ